MRKLENSEVVRTEFGKKNELKEPRISNPEILTVPNLRRILLKYF